MQAKHQEIPQELHSECSNRFVSQKPRHGAVTRSKLNVLYDVIVVGGGPAGISGAIRAAQMGHRAIIIDRPKSAPLGDGLDPFFGSPTGFFSKALREAGKDISIPVLRARGWDDGDVWMQIQNKILRYAIQNAEGQLNLLSNWGVDYLQGEVTFLSQEVALSMKERENRQENAVGEEQMRHSVLVRGANVVEGNVIESDDCIVTGSYVLLCTGSKARRHPGIPFDGHRVFDSDTINFLSFLPKFVIISGAGFIGLEFASIFCQLGAQVKVLLRGTLASCTSRLGMDKDVAAELSRILQESGVHFIENAKVGEFVVVPKDNLNNGKVTIRLSDESTHSADIFLAAMGRDSNGNDRETNCLGVGIHLKKFGNFIDVNPCTLETNIPDIYAAGDVIGYPALASTSMEQALKAVSHMFTPEHKKSVGFVDGDPWAVDDFPVGVWTIPEVGYFGYTTEKAVAKRMRVCEGRADYGECLRGRTFSSGGLMKLVVNIDDGSLVGIHIIGSNATEMVHYGMSLVKSGTTIYEILSTTFVAVTYHELFKVAALDAKMHLDLAITLDEILLKLKMETRRARASPSIGNSFFQLRNAIASLVGLRVEGKTLE